MSEAGSNGAPNGNGGVSLGTPTEEPDRPPTDRPDPEIEVISARAVERAMAPEIEFAARVTDASERPIHLAAFTVTIEIEPSHRSYDEHSRELLGQLFGVDGAWSASTRSVRVARVTALRGPFQGSGDLKITVPLGYDLEVAASAYLYSLPDGEAPLRFHFNGTVYYRGADGSLQLIQVPWDRSSRFRMPVELWRRAIADHYPNAGWVAAEQPVIERLRAHRVALGAHTYSAALEDLLDRAASVPIDEESS